VVREVAGATYSEPGAASASGAAFAPPLVDFPLLPDVAGVVALGAAADPIARARRSDAAAFDEDVVPETLIGVFPPSKSSCAPPSANGFPVHGTGGRRAAIDRLYDRYGGAVLGRTT
jgi:hypothetical protein